MDERITSIFDQVEWRKLRGVECDGTRIRDALLALFSVDPKLSNYGRDELSTYAFYAGEASQAGPAVAWCIVEALKASTGARSFAVFEVLYEAVVSTGGSAEAILPDGRVGKASELCGAVLSEGQLVFVECMKSSDIKMRRISLEIIDSLQRRGYETDRFVVAVDAIYDLSADARREFQWFRSGGFGTTEDYPGDPDKKWNPTESR